MATVLALAKELGKPVEPYVVAALSFTLELCGDKDAGVGSTASQAAKYVVEELATGVSVRIPARLLRCQRLLQFIARSETSVPTQLVRAGVAGAAAPARIVRNG